ncbi:MAG: magnesium transporter [Phycisphaerales bacterium]|nr:magnesium transporter [Phycisphaerales bacterium]
MSGERESEPEDRSRAKDAAAETSTRPSTVIENPAESSAEDHWVAQLLQHTIDLPILASAVEAQDPADAADTLETLDEGDAADVLEEMDVANAAEALSHMVGPLAVSVLEDLVDEDSGYAAALVEAMPTDDAADLLQLAPDEITEAILSRMSQAGQMDLRQLLAYDEGSAGGLMTPDVFRIREEMTVIEAVQAIREAEAGEETHFLFVVDVDGRLTGMLGFRRLVIAGPDERISDVCDREIAAIPPDLDGETVALEFEKYDYLVLPVVDSEGRLLGAITVDDVLDSIRAEGAEDAQMMVGAGREEMVFSSTSEKLRSRIPWLIVNLVTSSIGAVVVLQFEGLIAEIAILAVLMPVIANQSGNAGQQSLAVTLRGIVLNQVSKKVAKRLLFRESMVGAINGVIAGVLVGALIASISIASGSGTWKLGVVIAISMIFSLTIGTFTGTALPMLMRRLGADPATASTIFLTMVTDSLSFLIFLGTAASLSGWLGLG